MLKELLEFCGGSREIEISRELTKKFEDHIGNNIYKTVDSTKVNDISGNNYQIWEYTNEKSINGGEYFNGVYGSSSENEVPMEIGSIKPNYSF